MGVQLAKSSQDQEGLEIRLEERDKCISTQQLEIATLAKKIERAAKNHQSIAGKNSFKASTYQSEINQKEVELTKIKDKMTEMEEDMKVLTQTREKYRLEKDYLFNELKSQEVLFNEMKSKLAE